jgi:hypothetical protein
MKKIGVSLFVFLTPLFVLAQESSEDFGEINEFFVKISSFINGTLIPLLFGVALLVFLWGIFKYFILGGGDEGKREEGKQLMLYAIIGFVVMVSVFGIVNAIANGLGFSDDETIQNIPNVPMTNTEGS